MKARNSAVRLVERRADALARGITVSLRQRAYDEIKRRIITMRFRPGEYLNEALISAQLKIGRTPVHQALARLMLEGMIEIIPRKGAIVRPLSLDDVRQLIEVRLINEPYCAKLAAERATEAELHHLGQILGGIEALVRARDLEALMVCDRDFHAGISRAAKNRILADVLLPLHERSLRFWFISLSDRDHLRHVHEEHQTVFRALRTRDGAAAARATRAHIESFQRNIVKSL